MERITLFVVALLLCITSVSGCGSALDKPEQSGTTSNLDLSLVWPEDAYSGLGINDRSDLARAPSYITSIELEITGSDMETIRTDISTSSLKTTVNLTFGVRRFTVVARSSIGKTFTGSKTVDITRNAVPTVSISLEVNAPPTIEISLSNHKPAKGKKLIATVNISDPDLDDRHTVQWTLTGPQRVRLTGSGNSFSFTPKFGGKYTIGVRVNDGHGAVVTQNYKFTIRSGAPVITSLTYSSQIAAPGDSVTLECRAKDPDRDKIVYHWENGNSRFASGRRATFTIPNGGPFTIKCIASDEDPDTKDATKSLRWEDISVDFAMMKTTGTQFEREIDISLQTPASGHDVSGNSTTCAKSASTNYSLIETLNTGGFDLSSAGTFTITLTYSGACISGTPNYDDNARLKVYRSGNQILQKFDSFTTFTPGAQFTHDFRP